MKPKWQCASCAIYLGENAAQCKPKKHLFPPFFIIHHRTA
jgi:hypothetical protein